MRKKILSLIAVIFILGVVSPVFALGLGDAFNTTDNDLLGKVSKDAGYAAVKPQSVTEIIGVVISIALSLLGVIFLILMILGGYNWMTAAGDEQKVTKAKNIITAAIIGLIIVAASYAISYFVISALESNTLQRS